MAEKKTDEAISFEKALARLETIVADMEGGKLGLEKMMTSFEEGTKLVHYCSKKLNEVERKIEVLVKKGEEIRSEPFELKEEGGEEKGTDRIS
ncbi:MAG TPA: exodeoxyribonuclease VII small subunit [Verrucomicrobia bacterium]|nr:MAG: exodeoxyribonuclease VII small subunit [Lentisphaerae bacterium GWF2_57_35]HBA83447.1 exodeoxyribonuclease VII small subunit [Verrucomicrobiota bacterium]